MDFIFYAPQLEEKKELLDYVAGIEDTLDGSSGCDFTYLPVIFEDDCQICAGHNRFVKGNEVKYYLRIKIMESVQQPHQPDAD